MASFGTDRPNFGDLVVEPIDEHSAEAFFVPNESARTLADRYAEVEAPDRIKMLELDLLANRVVVYPLNTRGGARRFLQPKYDQILRVSAPLYVGSREIGEIDVETVLGGLPRGFAKDFQYGLGIVKDYRFLLETLEEHSACTHLAVGGGDSTGLSGDTFTLTEEDFDDIRAEIDRITGRANVVGNRIKSAHVSNALASVLGMPRVEIKRGKHPMTQFIADVVSGTRPLDAEDQDGLIAAAVEESKRIATTRPDALAKLQADIELVALDTLIGRFEDDLAAGKTEPHWQAFFQANPFALHLAFGYSVISVRSQASVGGRKLDGSGDKVADYLVKNPNSNNVGVFEIKRPKARLVRKSAYRGGVFAPTEELAGSVTQVLDQRYQLQRSLGGLIVTTRDYELEQYAIGCCLIIGLTPEGPDEQKSFELFRHSLKDVTVVTYDELLAKLRQLRDLLAEPEVASEPEALEPDAAVTGEILVDAAAE